MKTGRRDESHPAVHKPRSASRDWGSGSSVCRRGLSGRCEQRGDWAISIAKGFATGDGFPAISHLSCMRRRIERFVSYVKGVQVKGRLLQRLNVFDVCYYRVVCTCCLAIPSHVCGACLWPLRAPLRTSAPATVSIFNTGVSSSAGSGP